MRFVAEEFGVWGFFFCCVFFVFCKNIYTPFFFSFFLLGGVVCLLLYNGLRFSLLTLSKSASVETTPSAFSAIAVAA